MYVTYFTEATSWLTIMSWLRIGPLSESSLCSNWNYVRWRSYMIPTSSWITQSPPFRNNSSVSIDCSSTLLYTNILVFKPQQIKYLDNCVLSVRMLMRVWIERSFKVLLRFVLYGEWRSTNCNKTPHKYLLNEVTIPAYTLHIYRLNARIIICVC